MKEWSKWIEYDAIEVAKDEDLATLDPKDIMNIRRLSTDKNEATRGDKTYEDHPVKAKTRLIIPGYADRQALEGNIKTDAPTLSAEGTSLILAEAAGHADWLCEQGDVDSAFLNGKYLDPSRRVFLRAPRGGLPAAHGWPAIPEGTILKLKKGGYGIKDAPLLRYEEHSDVLLSLPGAEQSATCPALFLLRDPKGKVIGLIGVHVDDDLITGSKHFFDTVVAMLRKKFVYGKWHTANLPGENIDHCGRNIMRKSDGAIVVSQRNYALSLEPIALTKDRKRTPTVTVTPKEWAELRSGGPKMAWLVRGTRPDLAFRTALIQQTVNDPELTVQAILDYNKLVEDAKKHHQEVVFYPIDLSQAVVLAIGDASFMNVGRDKTKSQAGHIVAVTDRDFLTNWKGRINVMAYRSHVIKRVVRSTLAAETMSALEAVEEGDLVRAHLAEVHGNYDMKDYRPALN